MFVICQPFATVVFNRLAQDENCIYGYSLNYSITYENTYFIIVIAVDVTARFVGYCNDNALTDPVSNICVGIMVVFGTAVLQIHTSRYSIMIVLARV